MEAIVLSEAQLQQFIGQYIWPFLRIGALFMAMPIVGARTVNARARLLLALMLTVLVGPFVPETPNISFFSGEGFSAITKEVLVGLSLGFVFQVALHIFVLGGQFIAMKMGLGFASMNDPSNGITVTVLSQFYLLLSTILFLAVNGHLIIFELIVTSFTTLPIGVGLTATDFIRIASLGSWLFAMALVVALPVFTGLLIVNLAFGIMNRSAPQINVFTVGFPITLIFGLFFMWVALAVFLPNFYQVMDDIVLFSRQLLRVP
ncbi:MAG TPA: flagellar biosynthetic protein FliR [Cellvibrionaceae bacterium]